MTQPDINDAVDFAIAQTGKAYCTNRPIKEYATCYDCSALVVAGLMHAGIVIPPGTSNTVDLYNWGKRVGGLVSVTQGVGTHGAMMIRGKWYGYGSLGHVSFSLGNGMEMAAHGFRTGIHQSTLRSSFYQDAFVIPGVNYHLPVPIDWPAIIALESWRQRVTASPLVFRQRGPDIQTLNTLLVKGGWAGKDNGKVYGIGTRDGVVHLKKVKDVGNTNGKSFGGPAADALLGIA